MRSPDKRMVKYKKGLWSPDEDHKLTCYVMNHGHDCWSSVASNAGLQRNGKSCRLRWINYLRPGLKRGPFSSQEEETILTLHGLLGNKWSQISQHLPGRTDNEIKNYWHSHLKKKVDESHVQVHCKHDNYTHSNNMASKEPSSCTLTTSITNNCAHMVQPVPQVSHVSNLPKLLFADWISVDEFIQQDFGMSSDESLNHERQRNEGSTKGAENQNCIDMGSNEHMLLTQMTNDQLFEFNVEDFDIDNLMYM